MRMKILLFVATVLIGLVFTIIAFCQPFSEKPAVRLEISAVSVSFSPDGKFLAFGDRDGKIYLWDVQGRKVIGLLRIQGSPSPSVISLSFSPNGELLASGEYSVGSGCKVHLWDIEGRKEIKVLKASVYTIASAGHRVCVAFSPDGKLLASAAGDGTIRVWDAASREEIVAFACLYNMWKSTSVVLQGTVSFIHGDVVSKLYKYPGYRPIVQNSVAFSPDGKLLVSGTGHILGLGIDDNAIRFWDIASKRQILVLKEHTGSVNSVVFSPNGKLLASGSDDGTVSLWDVEGRKAIGQLIHLNPVRFVAFSPDGRFLVSTSWKTPSQKVHLWDVQRKEEIGNLDLGWQPVTSISFSPNGKWLAMALSGVPEEIVAIWEINLPKR